MRASLESIKNLLEEVIKERDMIDSLDRDLLPDLFEALDVIDRYHYNQEEHHIISDIHYFEISTGSWHKVRNILKKIRKGQ